MNEGGIEKMEREIMKAIDGVKIRSTKYKGYIMMKVLINVLNKYLLKDKKYLAIGPNVFIKDDGVEYDILIINKNAKYKLTVPRKYVKLIIECKTTGKYEKSYIIKSYKKFKRKYKKRIKFVYLAVYSPPKHIKESQEKHKIHAFGIKKYNLNKKKKIYESLSADESLSNLSLKGFVDFLKRDLEL